MSQVPGKLASMMKGVEAAEREAGDEFRRIQTVYEARLADYNLLLEKVERLKQRLRELALQSDKARQIGEWGAVSSGEAFRRRLNEELRPLKSDLESHEPLLAMAHERLLDAEAQLLAARVERRRLETLAAQRLRISQLEASAREEDYHDELSTNRRSKPK